MRTITNYPAMTLRLSPDERDMLARVARRMRRSRCSALRELIRAEALRAALEAQS